MIYDELKSQREIDFKVFVSYLEIYNDKVNNFWFAINSDNFYFSAMHE